MLAIIIIVLLGITIDFIIQKDIVAPFCLVQLSLLMALILIILNYNKWEVVICDRFIIYLLSAIVSFAIGCLIIHLLIGKGGSESSKLVEIRYSEIQREKFPANTVITVAIICGIVYIVLSIKEVGFSFDVTYILRNLYEKKQNDSVENVFMNQPFLILQALAKVCFFELMISKYVRERRCSYKLFLVIVIFVLCAFFSTDRNVMIRFIIFCITLWVFFYMNLNKGKEIKAGKKIVKKLGIVVGCAFVFLYIMGLSKRYDSSFVDMVSTYAGSGLYNFNLFLSNFDAWDFTYGKVTFSSVNNVLASFGLLGNDYVPLAWNDDFLSFYTSSGFHYSSNIYSALKPFVQDFGFWGTVLFPLFFGLLYETLYMFAKRNNYGLSWILYAALVYPLVYFSILEQFFKRMHLGSVYELFWVIIIYFLIYKRWFKYKYRQE